MSRLVRLVQAVAASIGISGGPVASAQGDLTKVDICEVPAQLWYVVGEANLDPEAALPQFQAAFSAASDWEDATESMMLEYVRALIKARPQEEIQQNRLGLEYLRRAADRGIAEAQYSLALTFRDGAPGIVKNEAMMAHWFERAAKQGHGLSMSAFGASSAVLESDDIDFSEVYFWLLLAQANAAPKTDNQKAYWRDQFPQILAETESHLSPRERLAVQKTAAEWTPTPEVDPCS